MDVDKKSGNNLASKPSKGDVRYWLARVFKPRSVRPGQVYIANFYFARFQHAGKRLTVSLSTASKQEAAARAKERYIYLKANGWPAFTREYLFPNESGETDCTVGKFIEAAKREGSLSEATIGPYARAFRRIVGDIFDIEGGKGKFDYRGSGNRQWVERVHAIRLADVTPEKIAEWKRKFIAAAGGDVLARRRRVVSCNSHLRQARALFSKRHVLDRLKTIHVPLSLPFDGVAGRVSIFRQGHCG